jgi:alpha-1,3/alpha-1,6-mannosyltransferase
MSCPLPARLPVIPRRRASLLQRLYRAPFDVFETLSMNMADAVVVNSAFTRGVFHRTFDLYAGPSPSVLYPCVEVAGEVSDPVRDEVERVEPPPEHRAQHVLLSINRFERKKELVRAISGLHALRDVNPALFARTRLIVAGGYDPRVEENVTYHAELLRFCHDAGLAAEDASSATDALATDADGDRKVSFVRSFSDRDKSQMLRLASAVVYTPSNEHFGIVPIEAMAAARPVIAVASGGPLESVVPPDSADSAQGEATGVLIPDPPTPQDMADAYARVLGTDGTARQMGIAGRKRAQKLFSRQAFGRHLDHLLAELHTHPPPRSLHPAVVALLWTLFPVSAPFIPLYAMFRPTPSILPPTA